jgi:predicted RNA-binding protein with RPS1 domain
MIDINIKIGGKEHKGMMGMSLEDMLEDKPVITKKPRKKKKRKDALMKAVESAIPKSSEYTTETV